MGPREFRISLSSNANIYYADDHKWSGAYTVVKRLKWTL